jgi:hypothetical protein
MYSTAVQFEELPADIRHELEWIIEDKVGGPPVVHDLEGAGGESNEVDANDIAPPRRSRTPDTVARGGKSGSRRRVLIEKVSPNCPIDPRSEGAGTRPSSSAVDSDATGETANFAMSVEIKMAPIETDPPKPVIETPELETEAPELETDALDLEAEAPELETDAPELETDALELETETRKIATDPNAERRTTARHPYGAKVPAFGNRALRVLVGRDLGMGGMRIAHHPDLEVGDRLNLAIYGAAGEEPFLVWGTIARSEGENGMALVFDPVHSVIAEKLEKLVATLPAVESLHDDEAAAMGTVLTEILNE